MVEAQMSDIKVETIEMNLSDIAEYKSNPRTISKKDFATLKKSLKDFPSMLDVREIVVDENGVILGGNQRYKGLMALGKTKVKVKRVSGWTDEQKREFVIKDNIANGDWDNDKLANEWDKDKLAEWGLPLKVASSGDYKELLDVSIPYYTPAEKCPDCQELADLNEFEELDDMINDLECEDGLKPILRARAAFFTEFDFQKIADYYAKTDKETQKLMKRLGLVIVIPKEAYEMGMCDFRESFDEE